MEKQGKLYRFDKDKCVAELIENGYPIISELTMEWIDELNGTQVIFFTDYPFEETKFNGYSIIKSWCVEVTV